MHALQVKKCSRKAQREKKEGMKWNFDLQFQIRESCCLVEHIVLQGGH